MTEKEIRSLKKADLLTIFEEQKKELEFLKSEREKIRQKLKNKDILLDQPGNLMEAAMEINEIFRNAQEESEQSLAHIKSMEERQKQELQVKENGIIKRCELKKKETREVCASMLEETKQKCDRMEQETKEKCALMEEKSIAEVEKRWKDISEKLGAFYETYQGLKELIDAKGEEQSGSV